MAFNDAANFTDGLSAGLTTEVVPPASPCPTCGVETKAHHPVLDDDGEIVSKRRICVNMADRHITVV